MDAVLAPKLQRALSSRALRAADDETLVTQVRAGSKMAFETVYDRHHLGILAFCRHMLGSREEAEDAVQHTFIAAYQALRADDRDIALQAWLYAIARNRCLSVLRVRREHVVLEDGGPGVPSTAGLSVEVEQRDDLRAMLADLHGLPEDQRAALVLAELGAHSHDEIALILEVPTPKVKALVFQAREALMNRRQARDADCSAIREQLSVLRGGALRRGELRHHVAQCEGCRAFSAEVRRQRAGMAVLMPVAPTMALKSASLMAAFGAGGSTVAGGGVAGIATAGGSGGAAGAAGGGVSGGTAIGGTAAGGSAVGGAAAGGSAVGGTAAAGGGVAGTTVAASGVAGLGGSTMLSGGGAILGVKVLGAKALVALTLTGMAGGGYVAATELPDIISPPPAKVASQQPGAPEADPPSTGGGAPFTVDECATKPTSAACAAAPAAAKSDPRSATDETKIREACSAAGLSAAQCPDPDQTSPTLGTPTPSDHDGDGIPNGVDADGDGDGVDNAHDPNPTDPAPIPAAAKPGDRDGDGIPNSADTDRDGDGIRNRLDQCPNRYALTASGCPDPDQVVSPRPTPKPGDRDGDGVLNPADTDRDGDGIANRLDACPNKFARTDNGCPPAAGSDPSAPAVTPAPNDRDGDGVPNYLDSCPGKPADTANGCPEAATDNPPATGTAPNPGTGDRDGDGVPNYLDSCPGKPADTANGCPPPDRDGDGVPNAVDKCPARPAATADGCPEVVPVDPVVTEPPPVVVDPVPIDPPAVPAP